MKIAFIGDIALTGILNTNPDQNQERFKEPSNYLKQFDEVFANLEVPVKVNEDKNDFKNYIYYSTYNTTESILNQLGITCVSLANNHIYDCSLSGLKATIELLEKNNIRYTGAGWKQEHIEPVIIENKNSRIGFIAYVDKGTEPKTEYFPELKINYFSPKKVLHDIQNLKPKVDKIIASVHWGIDYSHYPTREQVEIATELTQNGLDVLMGHHPHTLQPYTNSNNKLILYSLGGLTFGDYLRNKNYVALYKKTKQSVIASINTKNNSISFKPTKELPFNYIILNDFNYNKWTKKKWKKYELINKYKMYRLLVQLDENIIDRIIEYFYGYHQKPLKRLLQLKNYKKIVILFREMVTKMKKKY